MSPRSPDIRAGLDTITDDFEPTMISIAEPRNCTNAWSDDSRAFSIVCKIPAMTCAVAGTLERQGFHLSSSAATILVLDAPCGFALHAIEALKRSSRRLIVVTESPCVEYWEDLWDLRPEVLLVGRYPLLDLTDAIGRVTRGERYRLTPESATRLTPTERRILRLLACGQSNQQIAEQITMQLQTVKNTLVTIYQKLGFRNRSEALLYYWGIWQAIEHTSHVSIE